MSSPKLSTDGKAMTVHVPMTFQTRGGRKLVVTPDGVPSWLKIPVLVEEIPCP